jgi:xylulokinase
VTRILTADFGTTATKAALWDDRGLVAVGSAPVATSHRQPGWAEQEPEGWWRSLRDAVARLPAPDRLDAVGLCGARETFVPVGADLLPVGPGVLWADRRAGVEAAALLAAHDGREAVRQRIGLVLDGSLMVAKVAWLAAHEPRRLGAAAWLLSPRDWVAARLTGTVATDPTMASKTGFFTVTGDPALEFAALAGTRLARVVASDAVVGAMLPAAAASLGLPAGVPVVAGAGDRACEVLGTAASPAAPMVSLGTTANVSVPVTDLPVPPPPGLVVTRGAQGGWIFEAGMSASGAAIDWLARLTGASAGSVYSGAARSEPGARGVVALPWLNGSRAPWWRPGARAAFAGLTAAHGRDDLARAIIEGVALDVDRSLAAVAPRARAVQATGGGSAGQLWRQVLAATGDRTVVVRALPDAASAGACLLAAAAIGADLTVDRINPVVAEEAPDPALVSVYAGLRALADRVAGSVVELDFGE